MVRAGIPERVAMQLTGHKTRRIFDRYHIVSEADLLEAAARLDQHLAEQPTKAKVARIPSRKNTPIAEDSDRSRTISDHSETEVAVSA